VASGQQVGGVPDLALPGQEDQDVAGSCGGQLVDRVEDGLALVGVRAAVDRPIPDLYRVRPAGHLDDRRAAEGRGELVLAAAMHGELDALDLIPAPFPLHEILGPRDRRHIDLLFGIGGLSYGNVSARYRGGDLAGVPDPDDPVYWMSASGVDKSDLRLIGEHILLVRGYDAAHDRMVLSVPAGVKPRRVSVDAIEHWMIYREHPEVGAILHVHGWIDGTSSTEVNYPCGTVDLASAVAELVRRAPDPARAVVGLRNHGLTITGQTLDEIFDRVGAKISPRVPME